MKNRIQDLLFERSEWMVTNRATCMPHDQVSFALKESEFTNETEVVVLYDEIYSIESYVTSAIFQINHGSFEWALFEKQYDKPPNCLGYDIRLVENGTPIRILDQYYKLFGSIVMSQIL